MDLRTILPWACAAAAVLAILVVLAVFLRRRSKRRKLLAEQLSRKLREEALDRALANRRGPAAGHSSPDPVQVQYKMTADRKGGGPLLRLTEQNQTVTRVYLLDRAQRLFLGVQDGRTIVRKDYDAHEGILCELYAQQGGQFARALGGNVQLQRGKAVSPLAAGGTPLRTGDRIILPGTQFLVELL